VGLAKFLGVPSGVTSVDDSRLDVTELDSLEFAYLTELAHLGVCRDVQACGFTSAAALHLAFKANGPIIYTTNF
jgi:hypothetical protein